MNPGQITHVRAFPSDIVRTGQRQLTGRLVPYNEIADVMDILADGRYDIYREGFKPGAFAPQAGIKGKGIVEKIGLVHRHEGGLGYLGPFTALREEPDGLWGDALILPTKAEDVGALLQAGVDELSIEFRSVAQDHTMVDDSGVRWRVRAHLDQVALEPKGAYRSAQVLQFRAEMDREKAEKAEEAAKRAEAEAAEAEEWRQAQAAAEEARARAEKEAEAAIERRRRFEEMAERFDDVARKQDELTKKYLPAAQPHRDRLPRS